MCWLDSVRWCTIGLSDDGLVATANTEANTDDRDYDYQLVSGGEVMLTGRLPDCQKRGDRRLSLYPQ